MIESVIGWPRGGLTAACLAHYRQLLAAGVLADRIVWIAPNQTQAAQTIVQLEAQLEGLAGPLRVETFYNFANRMLAEFWGEVLEQEPELPASFEPPILDQAQMRYCVERACSLCPDHGALFEACGLSDERLWDQIASAAWVASTAGIAIEAIGNRLRSAWPDGEDEQRLARLAAISCCGRRTRQVVLGAGALDAGLVVELFGRVINDLEAFWQDFDHLIIDRIEDSSAVALEFYRRSDERQKALFVAYTVGSGVGLYTALPRSAAQFVARRSHFRYLPAPADAKQQAMRRLADRIARQIDPQFKNPLPVQELASAALPVLIEAQTTVEAAEAMAGTIQQLLKQNVPPDRLAIVAPLTDMGLVSVLEAALDVPVQVPRSHTALVRHPLVWALLSALELAHPEWGLFPSFGEARLMLGLLLGLDPVRAELLAADGLDPVGRCLRGRDAVRYPERIGFAALDRYQNLVDWLDLYQQGSALPPDHLWSTFASDLLSEVLTEPADWQLLQELIAIVRRFRRTFCQIQPRVLLHLLRSGQVTRPSQRLAPGRLVLSTPLTFINQGLAADYQFWFDITSERWSRSSWRGLYNHRVLTPEWDGTPYGAAHDREDRAFRLSRTLFSLCCRTSAGLYLVRSSLGARGEANTGLLDQQILTAARP